MAKIENWREERLRPTDAVRRDVDDPHAPNEDERAMTMTTMHDGDGDLEILRLLLR